MKLVNMGKLQILSVLVFEIELECSILFFYETFVSKQYQAYFLYYATFGIDYLSTEVAK